MHARSFLAVAASLAAGLACADGPATLPYTTVQASFANIDIDDFDNDAEGLDLSGSFDVGRGVFLLASYSTAKTDDFTVGTPFGGLRGSVEVSGASLGAGYHHALQPDIDLVATAAVLDAEARFKGDFAGVLEDEDDTGWSAGAGVRALVAPAVEILAGLDRTDLYDDAEVSWQAGGFYYATAHLGFGITYEAADESRTTLFTARWAF